MNTNTALHTFTKKGAAEKRGIEIIETYWINGHFDIIHVFKAKSEEQAIAHSLSLSALGNVRTQTCRAHNRQEMDHILNNVFDPYDLSKIKIK